MGFWDLIKTAIIIEGVDHILHGDKKNNSGYDPGAWRREIDKENDSYREVFHDGDDLL